VDGARVKAQSASQGRLVLVVISQSLGGLHG
jgi:hypothetical protein